MERKARTLAAVVRLLLALSASIGFRLDGERLREGVAKATVLRAITSAKPVLPLALILRILGFPASRYHRWRSVAKSCGLDDRSSCPRTTPSQLTADEIASIKDMVLDPQLRHMPLRTLGLYAQRVGRVFASITTWARLARERGWRRLRKRVHPVRPTEGVRATWPNELWHIDVTILGLLDGTKVVFETTVPSASQTSFTFHFENAIFVGKQGKERMYIASFLEPLGSAKHVVFSESFIRDYLAAKSMSKRSRTTPRRTRTSSSSTRA